MHHTPTSKKILILATGGTIVCAHSDKGLHPHYNVDDLIQRIHPTNEHHSISGKMVMNIDSSNMNPNYWLIIAQAIKADYEDYDGFVITHGTDTMAYTAAALTYILEGLNKPVIITGSQYSMVDSKTDAIQNLNDAVLFAAEDLEGVFIAFDGLLINGTRAIKTKTKSYDAFKSVNYPPVAGVKHNRISYNQSVCIHFKKKQSQYHDQLPLKLASKIEDKVFVLKLFPGLDPGIFDYLQENMKGIIIESYGIGGVSSEILDIATKVHNLADAGVAVVLTTQCLQEGVNLQIYEVGRSLPLDKIIYGKDMNTEALVPKLMWALGKTTDSIEVKRLVETPVRGDILENPEQFYFS
ncbi:MAG: L-asparaginase [Desulforhopalus sp.]|jgi:L-asparaginase